MAYKRQIAYFDLVEDGLKKGNAGFCKWEYRNGCHRIEISIHGLAGKGLERPGVYTKAGSYLGELILQNGRVEAVYRLEDTQRDWSRELGVLRIPLSRGRELEAEFQEERKEKTFTADTVETAFDEQKVSKNQKIPEEQELPEEKKMPDAVMAAEREAAERIAEPQVQTLWDRLAATNETMCPFGTETEYYRIALEDIYRLKEEYHVLRNNQFLLHGYYNYHYLILGKKTDEEEKYWLGVPGIYHEREKMAARMYGFEKFEGKQRNYGVGDQGYYLISAE